MALSDQASMQPSPCTILATWHYTSHLLRDICKANMCLQHCQQHYQPIVQTWHVSAPRAMQARAIGRG